MTDPTPAPPITRIPNIRHKALPPREERDWVLSMELLDETGITYRQLDYWCRTSLLTPREDIHGSGWTRSFDADHVDRASCIRMLLDAGISLQIIREHIEEITQTGRLEVGEVTITVNRPDQTGDAA